MKAILILIFSFAVFYTSASEDYIISSNYKNVHLLSGGLEGNDEKNAKIGMFFNMVKKLVESKKYKEEIYIKAYCDDDNKLYDTMPYSARYGNFTCRDYDTGGIYMHEWGDRGLIIEIVDKDCKLNEWLQFVNSVFINVNYIKQYSLVYHIAANPGRWNAHSDTSISHTVAMQLAQESDNTVDSILQQRWYCGSIEHGWQEVFYYSGNKFHLQYYDQGFDSNAIYNHYEILYKRFTPSEELKNKNSFLELDNIVLIQSTLFGDFIYTNDSTFYFVTRPQKKVSGPYVLNHKSKYGSVYLNCFCISAPIKHIEISFESEFNGHQEYVFTPDSEFTVNTSGKAYIYTPFYYVLNLKHNKPLQPVVSKPPIKTSVILYGLLTVWLVGCGVIVRAYKMA